MRQIFTGLSTLVALTVLVGPQPGYSQEKSTQVLARARTIYLSVPCIKERKELRTLQAEAADDEDLLRLLEKRVFTCPNPDNKFLVWLSRTKFWEVIDDRQAADLIVTLSSIEEDGELRTIEVVPLSDNSAVVRSRTLVSVVYKRIVFVEENIPWEERQGEGRVYGGVFRCSTYSFDRCFEHLERVLKKARKRLKKQRKRSR